MYDYRKTKVRIEHEIRLVLRGDSTVDQASDRILIIAKLWDGKLDDEESKNMPEMRIDSDDAETDRRPFWLPFFAKGLRTLGSILVPRLSFGAKTESETESTLERTNVDRQV